VRRLRFLTEYALARVFIAALELLPARVARGAARGMADLIFLVHRPRRRIALENVRASGVAADEREARRIARGSFRHLALLVLESLRAGVGRGSGGEAGAAAGAARVEWDVPESVEALLEDERRGLILASGHLGSWEAAAQILSLRKPVMGITSPMNNPYVERLIRERKPRGRFTLMSKHALDTGRFFACLKRGDILALMIDKRALERGMEVEFFGRPAATYTSIALLHLTTRVPIVFGWCERVGPGRFRFHADEPLRHARSGDKERDVRAILEALNRKLERAIRRRPDQYMWGHRRWR